MTNNPILRHFLATCALTLTVIAGAQQIDLTAATLNGESICELALDDITGMLGRPSAVEAPHPIIADILGPEIDYHHLGIGMLFRPGDPGEEKLLSISIYLSRAWDEDASEWYQVFTGALTPNVNGNWRIDKTLSDLALLGVREETPDEQRRAWEEAGVLRPGDEHSFEYLARLTGDHKQTITFFHEPITRFMERAALVCPSGDDGPI